MPLLYEHNEEQRWVVRIRVGNLPLARQAYFRNEMTYEFYARWKWFFEYRAARIKVANPRVQVHYEATAYKYTLPEHEYRTKLQNKLIRRKGQVTEFRNKIANARANYNELFPIEEHPHWVKVQAKLNRLIAEYEEINQLIQQLESAQTK